MKYSEFREYLKRNEIPFRENEEKLMVTYQFEIPKKEEQTIWFSLGFIDSPYEFEMLKRIIELAETPLDERELPLSNDPDEGDFIIKNLDDEIKEFDEFYEVSVTELKKFRGKGNF